MADQRWRDGYEDRRELWARRRRMKIIARLLRAGDVKRALAIAEANPLKDVPEAGVVNPYEKE